MVETMQNFRQRALNRTVVVWMDLSDVEIVQKYADIENFWEDQLEKDKEKRRHKSFEVFWTWLSKSYFVTSAIALNFFKSDIYIWNISVVSDEKNYNGQ